jgi:hypothetical protein
VVIVGLFATPFLDLFPPPNYFLVFFKLIRWNPAPTPATTPAIASDSSGLSSRSHSSSSRYNDRDTRRFKEECDATRHELEIFSKEAGIAELEWEHQCKQLLVAIDGESCNLLNLNLILN